MDPSNLCLTVDSGGSGSHGNGGRSAHTSSRRRGLMPSSPTGTPLMSEFNAAADGGDSGSSPSSGGRDVEPEESRFPHSRRSANSEASPTQNQVGLLLLLSPAGSPAATDDEVLIMDGVLVDNGPGTPSSARRSASNDVNSNGVVTPSSARRSASIIHNNGSVTSSSARRSSLFVDNSGPGNRPSVSSNDLALLSSSAQGSSRGGSGGRRGGSNGQQQVGSSSWRQVHGAGPSNIQQGPELTFPMNVMQGPNYPYPYYHGLEYPYPSNYYLFPMAPPPWMPVAPPYLTYTTPMATIDPAPLYAQPGVNTGTPGVYPPRGVTIRPPPGYSEGPLAPEQPAPNRVTIKAPPASEGGPSEPKQPETKPPPAPEQPEARPPTPRPEQPAAPPLYLWPPNQDFAAAIYEGLYRPTDRPRLPVFKELCPDDEPPTPASP
ncbi:hypothetical protein BS78_01G338300 [Paspalum vaginatum]|nr:hypothetical protein BS78_01G338300 [Paspalum vaginatum]